MKFRACLLAALLAAPALRAQSGPKNEVKINLPSLALSNFSLQYERALVPGLSVALGVRFGPERNLPFQSSVLTASGDEDNQTVKTLVEGTRINNYAFTPEVRYYFGKGQMQGFYIGLFGRVGEFNIKAPLEFDDPTEVGGVRRVNLKGGYTYGGGGLQIGAKWNLSPRISLDWYALGPMYTTGTIKLEGASNLTAVPESNKEDIRQNLREVFDEVTVDNAGARASGTLGLPGLRTGLALGFRF